MVKRLTVEGFAAIKSTLLELEKGKGIVYVLFSASLDDKGQNWCPDCVTADPVVERNVAKLPDSTTFVHCHVGQRDYWKDPNNDFRKDPQFKLKSIPTLIRVGTPKRLEESQCASDDLIQMLFEDED